MPFARVVVVTFVALFALAPAPVARAQSVPGASASEDNTQNDSEPCDGKARLRGPVFAPQSGNILPDSLVALNLIAEMLKTRCAGKTIVIEGHTDTMGDPQYNLRLSEVRAREIKRLLVERGVPADQLETVGYGETRPITTDPALDALNRRITFVTKEKAIPPTQ